MPIRIVFLSKELDPCVDSLVKRGRYASGSEAIRAALRLLVREEREQEGRVAALCSAIEEGLASGDAEPGVLDRMFAYIDALTGQKEAQENPCGAAA